MRLFLDSSVILSACGSEKSLSRLITLIAEDHGWELVSSAYCRAEVARNIGKFPSFAISRWDVLRQGIVWVPNALTTQRPLLLAASKDKPVLISALADRSKILLTLDIGDFGILLGATVYGTYVTTPRDFLTAQGLG